MQPYQQRVVEEESDLREKISNLEAFTVSSQFKSIEFSDRNLLFSQLKAMRSYRDTLAERIASF